MTVSDYARKWIATLTGHAHRLTGTGAQDPAPTAPREETPTLRDSWRSAVSEIDLRRNLRDLRDLPNTLRNIWRLTVSDIDLRRSAREVVASLRQNRRFTMVMAVILFLAVDGMAVYAVSHSTPVLIPRQRLGFNVDADSLGPPKLVYHGKNYYRTGSLTQKQTLRLTKNKLGTTNDIYDPKRKELPASYELYTDAGVADIYSVRGYDSGAVLIGVPPNPKGDVYALTLTSTEGITVRTGADYFERMQLKNNTVRVYYHVYASKPGQNGVVPVSYHRVNGILWNRFVNALYCATPKVNERIPIGRLNGKTIHTQSPEGVSITLDLYENGTVTCYGDYLTSFKMDKLAFNEFWNALK